MTALRFPRWWPAAAALLFVLTLVLLWRGCSAPDPLTPAIVTLTPDSAAYYRSMADARAQLLASVLVENSGMRGMKQKLENRIRGLEARRPDTIYAVDTLIAPPDSLPIIREITPGGRAQFELLVLQTDTIAYRPHHYSVDIAACDRGVVPGATGLVCRTAPFGHLSLLLSGGAKAHLGRTLQFAPRAAAGLTWTPAFRSGWQMDATVDLERRAVLDLRREIRFFE